MSRPLALAVCAALAGCGTVRVVVGPTVETNGEVGVALRVAAGPAIRVHQEVAVAAGLGIGGAVVQGGPTRALGRYDFFLDVIGPRRPELLWHVGFHGGFDLARPVAAFAGVHLGLSSAVASTIGHTTLFGTPGSKQGSLGYSWERLLALGGELAVELVVIENEPVRARFLAGVAFEVLKLSRR